VDGTSEDISLLFSNIMSSVTDDVAGVSAAARYKSINEPLSPVADQEVMSRGGELRGHKGDSLDSPLSLTEDLQLDTARRPTQSGIVSNKNHDQNGNGKQIKHLSAYSLGQLTSHH